MRLAKLPKIVYVILCTPGLWFWHILIHLTWKLSCILVNFMRLLQAGFKFLVQPTYCDLKGFWNPSSVNDAIQGWLILCLFKNVIHILWHPSYILSVKDVPLKEQINEIIVVFYFSTCFAIFRIKTVTLCHVKMVCG